MGNPGKDKLSELCDLLKSMEEVESYIITDKEGIIHDATADEYNDNTINSCIYLWVTGTQLGSKFNMGEPVNLIYNLKKKKVLIQKYDNYLIIIYLTDKTKYSVFKKKLYELFNR
jgi:predicted regulator of Ras-like GTPase activity (Roadblock/LC7/MglB family)